MAGESINLAATAANHASGSYLVTMAGVGWTEIAPPDPQRWFVRFNLLFTPGEQVIFSPVVMDVPAGAPSAAINYLELKYRDCPSLVTGPWFCYCFNGATVQVLWNRVQR